MKILHNLGFSLFLLASLAHGEVAGPGAAGVVWSAQCDGYLVTVPEGWFLDNKIAANQGVDMFFLPTGAPRNLQANMPAYAYVMPTVKVLESGQRTSVKELINLAVKDYSNEDVSTTFVVSQTDWGLDSGTRKITVAHISSPGLQKYDAIAYDEDDLSIFAVTVSAQTPRMLAEKEGVLKQIVSSAKVIHSSGARPPCPLLPGSN